MVRVERGIQSFKKVWCQFEPPRRSFFAYAQRATGTLTIGPDGVGFTSAKLSWHCQHIGGVGIGAAGNDLVNRWVIADVSECGHGNVVFLKDGRWLGWHSIVTRTDDRIIDALSGLATGATDGSAAPVAEHLQSKGGLAVSIWKHPWLTATLLASIPAVNAVSSVQDRDWTTAGIEIALVIALFVLFGSGALRRRDRA